MLNNLHSVSDGNPGFNRGILSKRILDCTLIGIGIPLIIPAMILIALWIIIASRGPLLFRQERIGHKGKKFHIYKFRSMKVDSYPDRHEKHVKDLLRSNCKMTKLDQLGDDRIIPGGYLLRSTGLDELPQLFNILRGEMSLVGPRPCLPEEYDFLSPRQKERVAGLPGLTGSWQVNGKNHLTFSEMIRMDIDYLRRSSLLLDIEILIRTPLTLWSQVRSVTRLKLLTGISFDTNTSDRCSGQQ